MSSVFENYRFRSELIVFSIRHPIHFLETALMAADVATIPHKAIEQLA
jgi:transaldolase